MRIREQAREIVIEDLRRRYDGLVKRPEIPSQVVEKLHKELTADDSKHKGLRNALTKRGVTPAMLRYARLGIKGNL